jgi:hypothetical protein
MRSDGRWYSLSCKQKRPAACRREDGSWFITQKAVRDADAGGACAVNGGAYDVPRTGYDNASLTQVTAGKRVILGL